MAGFSPGNLPWGMCLRGFLCTAPGKRNLPDPDTITLNCPDCAQCLLGADLEAAGQLREFVDSLVSRLPGFVLRDLVYDSDSKEIGLVLARGDEVLRLSWSRSRSLVVASRARSHLPGMDAEAAVQYVLTSLGYSRRVHRHGAGLSVFYRPCGPARTCKIVEYHVNKLLTPSELAGYAERAIRVASNPVVDVPPGNPGELNEVLALKLLWKPSMALARSVLMGVIEPSELVFLSVPVSWRAGRLCLGTNGATYCRTVRRRMVVLERCGPLVDTALTAFPQMVLSRLKRAGDVLLACMPVTRSLSIVYSVTADKGRSGCRVVAVPEVLSEPCDTILPGENHGFHSLRLGR